MPRHRLLPRRPTARRSLAMAALALLAMTLAAPSARAQIDTGTINLHLGLPAGTTLTQTWAETFNGAINFDRAVLAGGGAGPFAITGVPAANGYGISVVSVATTGDLCTGSAPNVLVGANETTIVFVGLTCVPRAAIPAPALGRLAPLLGLGLASLGAIALRRGHRSVPRVI